MKKFERLFLIALVFIVISVHFIAYRTWLFSSAILTQGDWVASLPNYSLQLFSLPTIWKSYAIGSVDFTPPFYIFMFVEGLLSHLGISYPIIERLSFMGPIALLTLPFSYIFIKSFTKHKIAAFIGALVYTYNTYFIIIQSGHLTLMVCFALVPLVLFLFRKSLDKRSLLFACLTGIVGFIISYYEFRAFYLVCIIGVLYYVYYLFILSKKTVVKTLKETVIQAILPIVIVFALNFYWILAFLSVSNLPGNSILNRDLFGKELYNVIRATVLFHPFWNNSKYLPFVTQPIPFYFFVIPFFAFMGLYLNRKNKHIIFWSIIVLLGIFLTKQDNPPFPDMYFWIYTHIPGFAAFREASKFYFFVALGYSVLIGAFFDWLWGNWKKGRSRIAVYILTGLVVFLAMWNTKPLVTGEYGTLFAERNIPREYLTLNREIDGQSAFFRTLWVPVDSRWGTGTNVHPKIGELNLLDGPAKKYIDAQKYKNLGEQFIAFFKQNNAHQLLNLMSVKYVIVPIVDTANDDNFYKSFIKTKKEYVQALDKISYLKKVDVGTKEIVVYENKTYRPHIYSTNEKESLKKSIPYKAVPFTSHNTTQYTITLSHLKEPVYLNFTDNYHPDWKLHMGLFHWYDVFGNKTYFFPESFHTKNAVQLNSFLIDPAYIKKHSDKKDYSINPDGSVNLSLTLYFVPQSYMLLGGIISLSAAALLLIVVVSLLYKNYGKK